MKLYAVCVLVYVIFGSGCARMTDPEVAVSYDDHHVIRIIPDSEEQQETLRKVLADQSECEVLREPRMLGMSVDVLCHERIAQDMGNRLTNFRLPFSSERFHRADILDDAASLDRSESPSALNSHIRLDSYNRYADIQDYLTKLEEDHPDIVSLEFASTRTSHEGRNLTLVRIGTSPLGEATKSVWIDAGIHAREWIAPATALFLIDKLVRVFKKKAALETLSEREEDVVGLNWLVMPLLNPDGYEFSHTNDRMWRKNRSPAVVEGGCAGTDLNRNFDVDGYGIGASEDPCKETYQGTSKNSEPEVKMASEIVMKNKDAIKASISLHSYGQVILTSWGYKKELPPDNERLVAIGKRLADAIKTVNGREYTAGPCADIFYAAGGASDDFAKAKAEIAFVATIELPDKQAGFVLPANQIVSVGNEIWEAMFQLARTTRNEL